MTQIDEKISAMFAKVNERKAKCKELRQQIACSWKTNCSFALLASNQSGVPVHLQTATNDAIEAVASSLCLIAQGRTMAEQQLGVKMSSKIQGYTVDDWFSDLKKRLASINIREEEKQLEALEQRLNSVLSPEARRQLEVEQLEKELGITEIGS